MKDLYASGREAPSLAPQLSIADWAIDQLRAERANPRRHSNKPIPDTVTAFGLDARTLLDCGCDVARALTHAGAELHTPDGVARSLDHFAQAPVRHAAIGLDPDDLAGEAEAVHAV